MMTFPEITLTKIIFLPTHHLSLVSLLDNSFSAKKSGLIGRKRYCDRLNNVKTC